MGKVKEQLYRHRSTVGEILKEEYMIPLNLSMRELAKKAEIGVGTVSRLINGRCAISRPTAEKLAKAFDTTTEFWMNFANNRTNPYPSQYGGY